MKKAKKEEENGSVEILEEEILDEEEDDEDEDEVEDQLSEGDELGDELGDDGEGKYFIYYKNLFINICKYKLARDKN